MGIVTDVILPMALAFIMFSLGLGLTLEDFARVAKQPRDFLIGAVSQIALLPIVAFFLVSLWPLSPEIALGVMIIAVALLLITPLMTIVIKKIRPMIITFDFPLKTISN